MATEVVIDAILARHGIAAPAAPVARQGVGAYTWRAGDVVVKIARPGCADEVGREAYAATKARAAGVRTPALVAWDRDGDEAYSIWERVDGEPAGDAPDPAIWRDVGRQLAKLHTVADCDDGRALLRTDDKRDGRPHLHALAPDVAARIAGWLDRLERAAPAPPCLLHYDVHEHNVLVAHAGATLIDWGDAGWGDPARDFGAIPIHQVPAVLDGYEEVATLGEGAEARIVRAVLGQSVRMLAQKRWREPLDTLLAFAGTAPPRWREYLLYE